MKYIHQILLTVILLSAACSCRYKGTDQSSPTPRPDTLQANIPEDTGKVTSKYIMGDRLKVSGDFNGDGNVDTIYESYISSLTRAETYMTMDSTDLENNISLIIKNKPISRIYSNIKGVDTFTVTDEPQLRGLMILENLGDIYGGKGDEIGFVIDWADYSNFNTYHIITLAGNKWREIFSFHINESINYQPENLFDSTHIIHPLTHGRIRYKYFNNSAEVADSIVTL